MSRQCRSDLSKSLGPCVRHVGEAGTYHFLAQPLCLPTRRGLMDASSSAMDVSLDPVSLRAAALSTLKSKRRKPVPEKATIMAPSRIPPASDFQLDYGQEDVMLVDPQPQPELQSQSQSLPSSPPPPPSLRKSSPKAIQKVPNITKDVQMREEGEISDEEEILGPTISLKRSPPLPPPRKSKSPIPAKALSPESVQVASASPLQKSVTPEERAPLSLLERFTGYAPSNPEEPDIAMSDANTPELDNTLSLLGPGRVRPGLLC